MSEQFDNLITTVYEVYTTYSETAIKGDLVGVYLSYEQAYNSAKGKGWYGGSGLVVSAKGFIMGEKVYVLKYEPVKISVNLEDEHQKKIDGILDKLTLEELETLNLDRDTLKSTLKKHKTALDSVFPAFKLQS